MNPKADSGAAEEELRLLRDLAQAVADSEAAQDASVRVADALAKLRELDSK